MTIAVSLRPRQVHRKALPLDEEDWEGVTGEREEAT
jgi:hypothetical protein